MEDQRIIINGMNETVSKRISKDTKYYPHINKMWTDEASGKMSIYWTSRVRINHDGKWYDILVIDQSYLSEDQSQNIKIEEDGLLRLIERIHHLRYFYKIEDPDFGLDKCQLSEADRLQQEHNKLFEKRLSNDQTS